MQPGLAAAEKVFQFKSPSPPFPKGREKKMKLRYYNGKVDFEKIEERRLLENAALSPMERWKKTFLLMALSAKFRKEKRLLKEPQRKGIVLKRKGCEFV